MSLKLKFVLGCLLLIAVFSMYKIITSVSGASEKTSAAIFSTVKNSGSDSVSSIIDNDTDHDGLNDSDESEYDADPFNPDSDGDGYLDGEEVVAGTDPLEKNAVKEKEKKKTSENLTTSYIQTLAGGYLTGNLSGNEDDPNDILANLDIFSSTILAGITAKNIPDQSSALLVIDGNKEDIAAYLTQAAGLMNLIPPQEKYFSDDTTSTKMYATLAFVFNKVNLKLNALEVPRQFADWHKETTKTLARSEVLYRSLANSDQDPLLAMAEIQLIPDIMASLIVSGNTLNDMLKANDINPTVHPYFTE